MKTSLILKGITPIANSEPKALNALFWADKNTDLADDIEAAELLVNITDPDTYAELEAAWAPEVAYEKAMQDWENAKQLAAIEGKEFDKPEPEKPAPVYYSADFGRVTD